MLRLGVENDRPLVVAGFQTEELIEVGHTWVQAGEENSWNRRGLAGRSALVFHPTRLFGTSVLDVCGLETGHELLDDRLEDLVEHLVVVDPASHAMDLQLE